MNVHRDDNPPREDLFAHLELSFIGDYLRARGYEREDLSSLPAAQANRLLREASLYASAKLAEVELRAHVVREIHGEIPTGKGAR